MLASETKEMGEQVPLDAFLSEVLHASERAANIARLCRGERELFHLLVAEKTGEERNKLFRQDFKTLADVLIQETVRHYLQQKFPVLSPHVFGEESSLFTNALGESVCVRVCQTKAETEDLLAKVLDGNGSAAHILATAVHEVLAPPRLPPGLQGVGLDVSQLGVWIDPIDCTGEYVKGEVNPGLADGLKLCGLGCVTVIIGAFVRSSGEPVVGVVNQPFWCKKEAGQWEGRAVWGAVCGGKTFSNVSPVRPSSLRVAVSETEPQATVDALRQSGWEVVMPAGAGYKMLCVVDGLVGCFVSSQDATYKWDTCGPHGVLRALGGDVLRWRESKSIEYNHPDDPAVTGGLRWRNSTGVLAYRDPKVGLRLMKSLQ